MKHTTGTYETRGTADELVRAFMPHALPPTDTQPESGGIADRIFVTSMLGSERGMRAFGSFSALVCEETLIIVVGMRTILLSLLLSVAVLLPATESNPRVARVIDTFTESSDAAQEAYEATMRAAEESRAQALNRARDRALRDLKRLVNPRSSFAEQAQVYTEVLRLDCEDTDAVTFFTSIGTLDHVLENLEPLVETDLLGNVVQPAATRSGTASSRFEWVSERKGWAGGRHVGNEYVIRTTSALSGSAVLVVRMSGSGGGDSTGEIVLMTEAGQSITLGNWQPENNLPNSSTALSTIADGAAMDFNSGIELRFEVPNIRLAPGSHRLIFRYQRGRHAAIIEAAALAIR